MRKIEISQLRNTHLPDVSQISDEQYELLRQESENMTFLNLYNPTPRRIDQLWANILFSDEADDRLNQAFDQLRDLTITRQTRHI